MFKPSLRKSILNDNLCLTSQTKNDCFGIPVTQKPKPIIRFIDNMSFTSNITLPSMMVPEQIIQKHQFSINNNYTHTFTPLSYDFKPYPKAVKQMININPKAAQAGRINQINYVVYEKNLFLWRSISNKKQSQMLKIHKFKQNIDVVGMSVLKNEKIFRKQQITILAVSFGNRIKLFKVDQIQLNLEDLMIKYQLKSCRNIQKIHFTDHNEIIFAGDSGQFSMISLNNTKQLIVKIKSSIIKKYLSKSAFDYFTRHIVRQVQVSQSFLYCLHDRISKSNYLMYAIKKAVNKVIRLSQQPKYIHEETFVDIYRFTSAQRKQIVFIGQLKQQQIQKKIKEGYVNFWGEGVQDPFRIISINAKGQSNLKQQIKYVQPLKQQKPQSNQQVIKMLDSSQLTNPVIQLTTKCGYIFKLIHETIFKEKEPSALQRQNFSFVSQPTKIPYKIGDASLFQPKFFLLSQQKQYRKNFAIKSLPISKSQSIILMNDCLMFNKNNEISLVRFDDLKVGLYETTAVQDFYLSEQQFRTTYQPNSVKKPTGFHQQKIFGQRPLLPLTTSNKYIQLFNNQKRWTVFDNEGRFHVYKMEPKHIIMAYFYYQCEYSGHLYRPSSQFDTNTNMMIESDLRLHSTIQKMIKVYGYSTFMKSIVQILINNSNDQRQYFYLQKDLFIEVIKKQFEFELPNTFEEWSYSLRQHNQAQKIVSTDKMLQFIWITLFQHQNKSILTSQRIYTQAHQSEYTLKAKEYSQAKSKLQYTAYGYALKSIFHDTIETLINFRAKQFKLKQKQLKQCQNKLSLIFSYLESKKLKSQTHEYKHYLQMKLSNLSKKKQQQPQYYGGKKLNTTFSTTYSNSLNNTQQSFTGIDEQPDSSTLTCGITYQSNQIIQRSIYKSIQKIVSLIDVMNILIEKDQRQGLPNFIEIITNFKNQIKIGQEFFKQELFISHDRVQFVHPQLVKQVESALPQLQLQNKIQFLRFKIARNIAINNSLNQVDLKSLNFDKLSTLVTSVQIPEVKQMFIGQKTDINFQKSYFYAQFLSICLSKLIKKVKQLSSLKQQKFGSLSQEINPSLKKKSTTSLATHLTVEKIIMSQQQLQYHQQEMIKIFENIKDLFKNSVQSLKSINGSQYYQSQKYLQRIIELLTKNFGNQQILIQTLELILRDANLLEKIHYMKKIKDQCMYQKDQQIQILKISKQKELKLQEKSTFQTLIQRNNKKSLQKTLDTQPTDSLR